MKFSTAVLLGIILAGAYGAERWIAGHHSEVIAAKEIVQLASHELRNPIDRKRVIDDALEQMDPARSGR